MNHTTAITATLTVAFSCLLFCGCGSEKDATPPADEATVNQQPKGPPNVLVITLDTTRADRLGCYGYDKIRTPNIDALAGEGVLFEEAFSVQPVTLPSHSSIFTGLYPYSNGVRDNNLYKLSDEYTTMAEVLEAKGYLTTAFISAYVLNRQFGLSQGFRYYNDKFVKPKQKGRLPVDRRASEVSFLARDWLEELEDDLDTRPFFLWLHYYDPHADYDPPHPYKTAYQNAYDGEIAYTDDWLGFFFDELKAKKKWDNTIVVLVADHGESLGEYGEKTHGMFIYRPTTHVPLIVRHPASIPGGTRISKRVSTVDIMPTILDILDVDDGPKMDGQSLLPLIGGDPYSEDRNIYSEVFIPRTFNWSEIKGTRRNDRFYVAAPKPELYALENGKSETENLIEKEAEKAGAMARQLDEIMAGADPAKVEKVAVSGEMVERLEALGYFLGGGDEPVEAMDGKPLPDPKDRIGLFNLQQRANGFAARGMHEQSVAILKMAVEKDPENPRFLMELGDGLMEMEKYEEAKTHLGKAIELSPNDSRLHFLLGQCYERWGKKTQAEGAYKMAIEKSERHLLARFHLGLLYIADEQWDEARDIFTEARKIKPRDVGVLNNLGFVAIKGHDNYELGISLIEEARKIAPKNPFVLGSLGSAYLGADKPEKAVEFLEQAVKMIPDNRQFIDLLDQVYVDLGNEEGRKTLKKRLESLESR